MSRAPSKWHTVNTQTKKRLEKLPSCKKHTRLATNRFVNFIVILSFRTIPFGKLRSRYRGVIAFKCKGKHRAKRKRRQQRTINRIQTQFRLKSMMILIFVFLIIFNAQTGNGIFKTFSQNQLNQCLKTFSLDSSNKRIKPLVLNESILETCHAA